MKLFFPLILLHILLTTSLKSQPIDTPEITQHRFNFKGFALNINDDVTDEKGNHLLVGEIHAFEKEEVNRDTLINRSFGLKGVVYDDKMGILICTDKNYKIIKLARSFIGEKIIYNASKKQFTIGANFFDYIKVNEQSFSAWQPVIIETDIQLKTKAWFVQRPYSCILKNIFIENDEILIFTRSNVDRKSNKHDEKAEIIRVATSKTHKDTARLWLKVLDILSSIQTPQGDAGRMEISEISKKDNAYYFTTSNLDQFTLKNVNHLYRLQKNKLTEVPYFAETLKLSHNYSHWVNINEFFATTANQYVSLTHIGASKKEITFSRTDTSFNVLLQKKIKLNYYADYDKMLLLPNKNILILSVNEKEMWSYYLYSEDMKLIKEINSGIAKDYYPQNLKVSANKKLECIFYIDNVKQKDCVLQFFNPD